MLQASGRDFILIDHGTPEHNTLTERTVKIG